MPLIDVLAEVDQLVSSLDSVFTGASNDPASKLSIRVAGTENLTVDQTRGTLRLSDCSGHLITEWSVPEAFLERVGGETN